MPIDLSTPESTRDFLWLCLNGRIPRTPAKLAKTMPDWLRTELHMHVPDLADLQAEAEELRRNADRAERAYVTALSMWINERATPTTN